MQYDDEEDTGGVPEPPVLDSWKRRRNVIYMTLVFCASAVIYLLVMGEDTRLNETIANGLILLASSTILYYVAGSVVDDYKRRR